MPPTNTLPVFALDEASTWDDLENDMSAAVEYQLKHTGKIMPLMGFAPLTEPEQLDTWEPMSSLPENLLMVSIERSIDAKLFAALKLAEPVVGEVRQTESFPAVWVDFDKEIGEVYHQMEKAGIQAFAHPLPHADDASFFFVRGAGAVRAFDKALRVVTGGKPE